MYDRLTFLMSARSEAVAVLKDEYTAKQGSPGAKKGAKKKAADPDFSVISLFYLYRCQKLQQNLWNCSWMIIWLQRHSRWILELSADWRIQQFLHLLQTLAILQKLRVCSTSTSFRKLDWQLWKTMLKKQCLFFKRLWRLDKVIYYYLFK